MNLESRAVRYGRAGCYGVLAVAALLGTAANAEVKPYSLFSDNAVLQRDIKIPVWGTANDGEKITISLDKQKVSVTAQDGKFLAWLKPMKAGGPYTLTIAGTNEVALKNILIGDVYVCSGQSNMEWPVSLAYNAQDAIAGSADPMLHLFTVPKKISDTPLHEVNSSWQECSPQTVPGFSAVGFFFGQSLRKALNVPIGLINTSWGGTPAEAWTSKDALGKVESLRAMAATPTGQTNQNSPSTLYNGMIAPLIPYAIRGAIWYQGESNAGRAYEYQTLFPTMITNWRTDWAQGDFPFFLVQLAPFMKITPDPTDSAWAELREAQRLSTIVLKNVGMAVITDVGDEDDIHPRKKQPVGERLALAARAIANRQRIEYSGPTYEKMEIKQDKMESKIVLCFQHLGGGLVTSDGGTDLKGFTIAGEDKKFYNAQAVIKGNKVEVSCPQVPKPTAVRYGWANYPVINLANKAGLLASPFRTDSFDLTTKPH